MYIKLFLCFVSSFRNINTVRLVFAFLSFVYQLSQIRADAVSHFLPTVELSYSKAVCAGSDIMVS